MCGRFTQMLSWAELVSLYRIHDKDLPNLRANYNAAPTQDLGVIVQGEDGLAYKTMRWGLVPIWAKDTKIGAQCINARIESAAEKPAFRSAWKSRRCVVPASGYFEWKTAEVPGQRKPQKQPFYVSRQDGKPSRLHDRQPVIIDEGAAQNWIANGSIEVPTDLDDAVQIWPVTTRVSHVKWDYQLPGIRSYIRIIGVMRYLSPNILVKSALASARA
jgi:putative SOS response-associated peptidase YedK